MRKRKMLYIVIVLALSLCCGCAEEADIFEQKEHGEQDWRLDEVNLDGDGFMADYRNPAEVSEDEYAYWTWDEEQGTPEGSFQNEDYLYYLYEDHAVIVKYLGNASRVEIPSELDGKPVTQIGGGYRVYMGVYAPFEENTILEEVIIPDSVKKIGQYAFWRCESLQSVQLPDNLEEVSGTAFYDTPWYESLEDEFVIVGDGILIKYNGTGGQVRIPDGVKRIEGAFNGCEELTGVQFPDSLEAIGECAFSFAGFTELEIPDTVRYIGRDAFAACASLKKVIIGNGVTEIGLGAFEICNSLEEVTLGEQIKIVGPLAFFDTALKEITLPDSVRTIGYQAFMLCSQLSRVKNGKNVTIVDYWAFDGTKWLNEKTDRFVAVGKNVLILYNDVTAKKLTVPDTITYIGGAFSHSNDRPAGLALEEIILPDSVRGVSQEAFSACRNLNYVALPDSIVRMEKDVFSSWGEEDIHVPEKLRVIQEAAFSGLPVTSLQIPDSVEVIQCFAFNGCGNLKDIYIPETVKLIEENVFYECDPEILTIHGKRGSEAERYALRSGIQFLEG